MVFQDFPFQVGMFLSPAFNLTLGKLRLSTIVSVFIRILQITRFLEHGDKEKQLLLDQLIVVLIGGPHLANSVLVLIGTPLRYQVLVVMSCPYVRYQILPDIFFQLFSLLKFQKIVDISSAQSNFSPISAPQRPYTLNYGFFSFLTHFISKEF